MMKSIKSFRKFALITAPLTLLALSGCATPFRAEVSRFQQLPAVNGQTFVIKAADPANDGGIEFGRYAGLVAAKMREQGFVPAANGAPFDLTVTLGYNVDQGKERNFGGSNPFYGGFGGYGGYGGFGGFGYHPHRFGGRFIYGYSDPFLFGGGFGSGFGYGNDSYTLYTSGVSLKIKRNADGQNVFEGKSEAKSSSNKLAYLVPNLVEAMFTGFPGNNGETVRISVAPEGK